MAVIAKTTAHKKTFNYNFVIHCEEEVLYIKGALKSKMVMQRPFTELKVIKMYVL